MKQLKLLKLQLDNFKGLKHVVIHANGENFEMEAPNGVGKTTLFDAFSWILFDKDSKGNQLSSDIKTLDSLGVVIPKLKHEAIADFDLDGNRFELKKVFYEKYSSKRGSNEETFDGHTTDYYIDGIKKSKKEYESFISEIITEDIFKLLTNPHYFNENMDAKKRREKLFEIFGDIVKDEDIFELREDLSIVKKMIEKHTLQESIDKAKKELSDIDKELKSIPVQIKENQNQIFGSKKIDAKKLKVQLSDVNNKVNDLNTRLINAKSGELLGSKKVSLIELESELKLLLNSNNNSGDLEKQKKLSDANILINKLESEKESLNNQKNNMLSSIESIDEQVSELRKQREELNNDKLSISATCNNCGQALPEDKAKSIIEEANIKLANKLEVVQKKGNELVYKKKSLKVDVQSLELKLSQIEDRINKGKEYLSSLEKEEVVEIKKNNDGEIEVLNRKINNVKEEIKSIENDNQAIIDELTLKYEAAIKEQQELIKLEAQQDIIENGHKRIEELKQKEVELSEKYNNVEHMQYLLTEFNRFKAELIESKMNERFEKVKFKLFETQVDGKIKDVCRTLYGEHLVPYDGGLNTAGKINSGLEIIKQFSNYYGINLPIFIDNAESVLNINSFDTQTIKLSVSKIFSIKNASYEWENEKVVGNHFEVVNEELEELF